MTRDSQDQGALEVIAGSAPAIEDPDLTSRTEREVNRLWAALVHAGRRNLVEVDSEIHRLVVESPWPEIRGQALCTLIAWGRPEARQRAIQVAADSSADELERMAAVEGLATLSIEHDEDLTRLFQTLASGGPAPVAVAARRALAR